MKYIVIIDWKRHCHYHGKESSGKWIKSHREDLDDQSWINLSDQSKLLLYGLQLYASDTNNRTQLNVKGIRSRLSLETDPDFKELLQPRDPDSPTSHGWIMIYDNLDPDSIATLEQLNSTTRAALVKKPKNLQKRGEEKRGEERKGEEKEKPTTPPPQNSQVSPRLKTLLADWNALAEEHGLKAITKWGKGNRYKLAVARVKDDEWWAEYPEALKKIPGSKFMMGEVDPKPPYKRFFASALWLVKADSVMHILEGEYDNDKPNATERNLSEVVRKALRGRENLSVVDIARDELSSSEFKVWHKKWSSSKPKGK